MAENRYINNLKGVLYYLDTALLEFVISNRELIKSTNLSDGRFFPPELAVYGVSYGNINAFFERRTMKENCMFYKEHLKAFNMDQMDFDRYIMMNNGNNNLDNYWVKFDGFGAINYMEVIQQDWPVLGSEVREK